MEIPKGYVATDFKYVNNQSYVRGQRVLITMPNAPGLPVKVVPVYEDYNPVGSYNHLNK